MKDYTITNSNTRNTLYRYMSAYRSTVNRYKENSKSWKTDATWERYWKEMNSLEDMIDAILSLRETYGFKTDERVLERYEAIQELRYTVTINCNL